MLKIFIFFAYIVYAKYFLEVLECGLMELLILDFEGHSNKLTYLIYYFLYKLVDDLKGLVLYISRVPKLSSHNSKRYSNTKLRLQVKQACTTNKNGRRCTRAAYLL